jgi:hypothetical protein
MEQVYAHRLFRSRGKSIIGRIRLHIEQRSVTRADRGIWCRSLQRW